MDLIAGKVLKKETKNDILKIVVKRLIKEIKLAIVYKNIQAIRTGGSIDGAFFNNTRSITETGIHLFKQYAKR